MEKFDSTTILLEILLEIEILFRNLLLSICQVTRPRITNNYTAVASMPRRTRTPWISQPCTRWNHADPETRSRRYTTFPSTGRTSFPPSIADPRDIQGNRTRSWRSRRGRCTRPTAPRVYPPDTWNKIVRLKYTYQGRRIIIPETTREPPEKRTIREIFQFILTDSSFPRLQPISRHYFRIRNSSLLSLSKNVRVEQW